MNRHFTKWARWTAHTGRMRPMRTVFGLTICSLLLVATAPAFGQGAVPRFEVFTGGSFLPSGEEDFPRKDSFGFQTSITFNATGWLGVVGDLGGQYSGAQERPPFFVSNGSNVSMYEYLVGPRFAVRSERLNVFAHALFGGASGRTTIGDFSDTEIALGGGGGLDFHISDQISIRAIQIDFIGSFADMLEDNVRIGAGVVFKFGR